MQTNNPSLSSASDLERRLIQAIDACDAASQREAAMEQRYRQATRRARLFGSLGLAMVVGTLSLSTLRPVGAQGYGPTLTSLQNQINTLLTRTQFQTADASTKTTKFVGCNVCIQSGSGSTSDNGSLTGLGNLTIGYNQLSGNDSRCGSHNLILGDKNNYTSFGGLVVGSANAISAPYASITGGTGNAADGEYTSVCGGHANLASGYSSSVSGGLGNTASGELASVSSGFGIHITTQYGHNP